LTIEEYAMTTQSHHDRPILVTGAAGAVGSIGRNVTAMESVQKLGRRISSGALTCGKDVDFVRWSVPV
jgi:hypothetical protein